MKNQLNTQRNWAVLFPVVLLLGLILFTAQAKNQPAPVDGFWEQVRATRLWLDAPHSPVEWTAEAQSWADVREVSLPDGQVVGVDTTEIVRQMSMNPPDLEKLKAYLAVLDQSREQWAKADCGDCKARLLTEILARPEFVPQAPSADPIQQLVDAINKWLNTLFGGTGGAAIIPPQVLTVILAVVLAGILAFVFRDVLRSLASEVELAGEETGENQPLTANLASQKAIQLSGSGDYRSAMRYLYLSALLLLDERGLLRYNRSLTNREYLRQVSGQPDLENNLRVIVDEFDRVWYGFQPVGPDEYARYVVHVSALEAIKP